MAKGISLHIGVGKVDSRAPCYDKGKYPCPFAENDASSMEALARKQNFKTTLLCTKHATTRNVLDEIGKAAKGPKALQSGDMFLLTYSGHGLWYDDPSGQVDEWYLFDRKLTSHELYGEWKNFQSGVRIFYTSDSCFSASMGEHVLLLARHFKLLSKPNLASLAAAVKASVLLISACQDTQQSSADPKRKHGFFTESLLSVWNNGGFSGNYKDYYDAVKSTLTNLRNQAPGYHVPQDPAYVPFGNSPSFEDRRPYTI